MYHCPKCDGKTTVTATRIEVRQRKCLCCQHIFYTEETELEERPPMFDSRYIPGRREYQRSYAKKRDRATVYRYQKAYRVRKGSSHVIDA